MYIWRDMDISNKEKYIIMISWIFPRILGKFHPDFMSRPKPGMMVNCRGMMVNYLTLPRTIGISL